MVSIFGATRPFVKPTAAAATTATTATTATATATTAANGSARDGFVAASTALGEVQSGLLNKTARQGRMPLCAQDWPLAVCFGDTTVGTLAPFKVENGAAVHDVSGAASNGKVTVLVDDGGTSGIFNKLRVLDAAGNARELPLQTAHKDLEDITALKDGSFVITSSLSGTDPEAFRTTRVVVDDAGTAIRDEKSVDLREDLFGALGQRFGAAFAERVRKTEPKEGGLNIEGIAATESSSTAAAFAYGLRSPLVDPSGARLDRGNALVAFVDAPFSGAPKIDVVELNLGGHGVRGMEYIAALKGHVVIGGPVEKGDGYSLWLWRKGDEPTRLPLEGFDGLRRPESVFERVEGERRFLVVMSEQSGPACEGAAYNFIKVEMTRGLVNPDADADARTVVIG